ncbi:MAG: peptidoglycan DD-metalloendopeptidase family protein [Gemmatimonadaceae bacterium]|nr:peptidoglycan DD-metalloendopeptidase family protein [Gemmatimonadaceae bacterium]MDQ3517422.1 peptidoglycan DD-metalloendopeptidase family protein [Gemmatimonadota bacterium]
MSRLVAAVALSVALSCLSTLQIYPQEGESARMRGDREQLNKIRQERQALEQRMRDLQGSVHDLSEEVTNIDRQADATSRLLRSLDGQLASISTEVNEATTELSKSEGELLDKRGTLRKRLIDIYKRGPLHTYEALLSAGSFGQMIARYKYLRLLAGRDRELVARVQGLRDKTRRQRGNLVRFQRDIALARQEKAEEERRLRALEQQRSASLVRTRRSAKQVGERLKRIARDEARLNNVIASFEVARRRNERTAPNAPRAPSALRTSDLGRLDWPVDGTIIYNFGRVVNPNNTATRWNGIGISAATGTPVRSVAAGKVVVAQAFGTYGPTVIVQHGGGDYSVYGSLDRLSVKEGALVSKGQTVGTVGSADPEMEPHLHFEIRPEGRAVDPLGWLRGVR